jgi:hypothetical protein
MAMRELKINIPEQLIEDTIRAEMVRQIGGENKEKLIESVVMHAMAQKKDSYSRETYFQETVNEMIRDTATEIFREWLEQNRKEISKALFKFLNDNKQERLTKFCESIAGNIRKYGVDVKLIFCEEND